MSHFCGMVMQLYSISYCKYLLQKSLTLQKACRAPEWWRVDCIRWDLEYFKSLFDSFLRRWILDAWWICCVAEAGVPISTIAVGIIIIVVIIIAAIIVIAVFCVKGDKSRQEKRAKGRVREKLVVLEPACNKVNKHLKSIIWQPNVEKNEEKHRLADKRYVALLSL